MRIFSLFFGSRSEVWKAVMAGETADTPFFGINHLTGNSIPEIGDFSKDPHFFKVIFPRFFRTILLYFRIRNRYDVVFGTAILPMAIARLFVFKRGAKLVFLNIDLQHSLATTHLTLKNHLTIFLLRHIDGIVCLSREQIPPLHTQHIHTPVVFVPLGVDTTFHTPVFEGRKNYILSGGRDLGRDYHTLFAVAQKMPQEHFLIFCDPRNLQEIHAVPHNVEIVFNIPMSTLREKYREAKMLVITTHSDKHTRGSDCSGQTVILDAMANGLPVIATEKAYMHDYFTKDCELLVAPPYNTEVIVQKIQQLKDERVRRTIAQQARKVVEEHFTTVHMGNHISQFLQHINV